MRRRRRLVAAVLHLVLGGFRPAAGAETAPLSGREDEFVVELDVVLASADDEAGNEDDDRNGDVVGLLAKSGVEVVILDVPRGLAAGAAESFMRRALGACRDAGTLKVVIPAPAPLSRDALCALAGPLGFQFAGDRRRDRALEFYHDLYTRRT